MDDAPRYVTEISKDCGFSGMVGAADCSLGSSFVMMVWSATQRRATRFFFKFAPIISMELVKLDTSNVVMCWTSTGGLVRA